jgi:hypothetical protein
LSKYEYAAANFAETCAWGGWLIAAETLSLDDEDVEIVTPANGALHDLPIGVGAVLLTLGPETKGQSSKRVDVPLADNFASGINPHYWYLKLMACKDNLGWIRGGLYSAIQMDKYGPVHISREHMCTLCYIFRGTAETPVQPPMMEPLATALISSFILLGCREEEAGHKSP